MTAVTRGVELRTALAAGDHVAVLALVGDLAFLEERCRESIDALLDDLAFVLRRAPAPLPADASLVHPSGARLDRDAVARIEAILAASRDELSRDADAAARLFPLLYTELFWHDTPERAAHHDGLPTPIRPAQLWRWMDSWRATFEARPHGSWLRRLRPPAVPCAAVMSWRAVVSVRSISPDGTRLLARGNALLLVDTRNGHVLATVSSVQDADGLFAHAGDQFVVRAGTSVQVWSGVPPIAGVTLGPHAHDVEGVVFSLDGREVITRTRNELRVFHVADGTCIATRTLRKSISRILPCAGGVIVQDGDSSRHWDYMRDQMGRTRMKGYAEWTAVSPAGDRLLSVAPDGLRCWTLPDAKAVFALEPHASLIAFHPSGASFAMRSDSSRVVIRDATTGAEIRQLETRTADSLTYDPTGRYLVVERSWPWTSQLWDLAASKVAATLPAPTGVGSRVVFSRDGNVLAIGIPKSTAVVDMTSLAPVAHWRDDDCPVSEYGSAYFSPSGETLVVNHHPKQLSFWDVERAVIRSKVVTREVTRFDRGGRVLGRCGDTLLALSTEDGRELWRAVMPTTGYDRIFAADAARLLLHSDHAPERVVVLGMDDGRERYRIDGETTKVLQGDRMLTRTSAGDVTVRAVDSGEVVVRLAALGGDSYALSPDRRWLAVHGSGPVTIWDLTTQSQTQVLPASNSTSISFQSDNELRTSLWTTQQSGNQDLYEEAVFDVRTGACIHSASMWENELPVEPRELASGVVLDGRVLRVDGVTLALPDDPVFGVTRSGAVRVASVRSRRVELYALQRATGS